MKEKIIQLKQGINLHIILSDLFKTNLICVLLTSPLEKWSVTKNALIPFLLKSGTVKYKTQEEINKKMEELYGTTFNCGVDKMGDNQVLKFYVETIRNEFTKSNENLFEEAMNILMEIVFNPDLKENKFNEKYLKIEKEKLKKVIESKIDDKASYALERCLNSMYNGEGFGLFKFGNLEDIDSISSEEMANQYINVVRNAKIDIFVSGNVDTAEVEKLFINNENIKKLVPRSENYKLNNEFTEIKEIIEKPKEISESMNITQGKLVIGLDVLSKQENLQCVALVYNAILGDGANSMLFQNVREKASLAYTTKSTFVKQKKNIFIRCGIEINNYEKALNIIKEQLENIKQAKFTDEDIENAKKYLISGVKAIPEEQDSEVVFYIGQELSKTHHDIEFYLENIQKVSKEEIIEFAKQVQINTIYFLKN